MQTNNLEKDGVYTIMCALIVKGQTDSAICSSAPGYLINKLEEVFSEIEEWNNEHAPRVCRNGFGKEIWSKRR